MLVILSLGAGVQSSTIYLMAVLGRLKIDHAVFADTQEEPESVYRHLVWLKSLDGPPVHLVTAGKLGDDLSNGKNSTGGRFASIPAFTTDGKAVSILRRQCTKEYKIEPIRKFIRTDLLGLKPRQRAKPIKQVFGISVDEAQRAKRIKDASPKWIQPVFPLIDLGWNRDDCVDFLHSQQIPHEVPKSACVFCPYHTDSEWLKIKESDTEAWNRSIQVDETLRKDGVVLNRKLKQKLYLHRSCVPLKDVRLSPKLSSSSQRNLMFGGDGVYANVCDEGMCGS